METKNLFDYLPEELDGKKDKVKLSDVKESPLIGVYFSAHWCPPCRRFTPVLSSFYNAANKNTKNIEIIFVSFDRNEEGFKEYYDSMPWLSFPFNSDQKMQFAKDFEIFGIPALLVFDKDGKLIDNDGRTTVENIFKKDSGEEVASDIIKKWNKK